MSNQTEKEEDPWATLPDFGGEAGGKPGLSEDQKAAVEKPISAFEKLMNRTATEKEKLRIYQIRDMLEIAPDDALWSIVLAFQFHLGLYEEIPFKVVEASRTAQKEAVLGLEKAANLALGDMKEKARIAFRKEMLDVRVEFFKDIKKETAKALANAQQTKKPILPFLAGMFAGAVLVIMITALALL